ncbi:ABC transporter ATP-binding protein [Desulfuromonas versatilis]|uniref:ABC transporter ATP-binding protein n=1 Tax=Desulfuromonas versatilis TaxID=2802975 RepID=A0ABM8HV93_9BACT|nr:ABC transporter ATP-binding protein [Desulfuromonas versatilis]BCR05833.1 ABC transporter ATP-binding protein [Desulfuromonas versatilis]
MRLPSVFTDRRRRSFIRLVANGLLQSLAAVATLLLVRKAFDQLLIHGAPVQVKGLAWIGLGLFCAAAGLAWLRMLERIDAERMGQDYVHHIRLILFRSLSSMAPRALQRRSSGAVMLRFVGDLTALRNWVSLGLARILVTSLTSLVALGALAVLNWPLALAVGLCLGLGLGRSLGLGEAMRRTLFEARRRRSYIAANINEKIARLDVVQAFGQVKRERRRVARQSRRLKRAMIDKARAAGRLRAVAEIAAGAAGAVVVLIGGLEVAAGRASGGTVVAALTIVGLLAPGVRELGRVNEFYQNARVSRRKILDFLKTPTLVKELRDAPDLVPGPGRLEFRKVHLDKVIRGFSAVAEPGRRIVLAGPNGAGKSTLFYLASRLIDPDRGRILLDGQDLCRHSLNSVHRAVGLVSGELQLLRGKVVKNLLYRYPEASPEELERVKRLCDLEQVLADLPEGDQTRVLEGGSNLSVGQRQRIALARALLGDPPLLLLDEADANLDLTAGAALDRVLAQYRGTVLMVTRNPERILAADELWYMEGGRLLEAGPPADLRHRWESGEGAAVSTDAPQDAESQPPSGAGGDCKLDADFL